MGRDRGAAGGGCRVGVARRSGGGRRRIRVRTANTVRRRDATIPSPRERLGGQEGRCGRCGEDGGCGGICAELSVEKGTALRDQNHGTEGDKRDVGGHFLVLLRDRYGVGAGRGRDHGVGCGSRGLFRGRDFSGRGFDCLSLGHEGETIVLPRVSEGRIDG